MIRALLPALLSLALATTALAAEPVAWEPYAFKAADGTAVEAQLGRISVPENRADPASRRIDIRFVRFPATTKTPGPPIVYLAGGPGGSGIDAARGRRFPIFMALRAQADVIALDQRGTGLSNAVPFCETPSLAPSQPLTRATITAHARDQLTRCLPFWEKAGIDIAGYNTVQSAEDVEALRLALGAPKINLWAISYGSHLGLAYLKTHAPAVDRAVFAGIEGPDDTVKSPADTDAMLARAAALLAADPTVGKAFPDLLAMMRRVHARLDAHPAVVTFTPAGAAGPVTLTFDSYPVRLLASGTISDPRNLARLPLLYAALDAGQYELAARLIQADWLDGKSGLRGMPTAMDVASGISPAHLARVRRQAETSLLGDALNFPMPQLAGLAPQLDLGEAFRAPTRAATPVLFISGTLDGRTYPAAARAALAGFPNGRLLTVVNGGHNIFEADPRVSASVVDWFQGKAPPEQIVLPPPVWQAP